MCDAEGAILVKTRGAIRAQAAEHVVVLAPLAPQNRGTSRHPGPLDTSLHEPNVVLVDVVVVSAEGEARDRLLTEWGRDVLHVVDTDGLELGAVFLVVLIQTISEQSQE